MSHDHVLNFSKTRITFFEKLTSILEKLSSENANTQFFRNFYGVDVVTSVQKKPDICISCPVLLRPKENGLCMHTPARVCCVNVQTGPCPYLLSPTPPETSIQRWLKEQTPLT